MLNLLKKLMDGSLDYRERTAIRRQIIEGAHDSRRELVEALEKEKSESFRIELLNILGGTRDKFFEDAMRKVIESEKSEKVLQTAAANLGKLGVGFSTLIDLLKHKSANVRLGAVWGLAALDDKRAVKYLLNSLDDREPVTCWWASPTADGYSVANESAAAIDELTGAKLNGEKSAIEKWIDDNLT